MSNNLHQKLLDEINELLNSLDPLIKLPPMKGEEFRDFIENTLSFKHRVALVLAHFNYQVENGGYIQYLDNNYGDEIPEVEYAMWFGADQVDSEKFSELCKVVYEYMSLGEPHEYDEVFEEQEMCLECGGSGENNSGDFCTFCGGDGYFEVEEEIDGWTEFSKMTNPLDSRYYKIENRLELFNQLLEKI